MKNLIKAMKLYITATIHPVTTTVIGFMLVILMPILFITNTVEADNEDYSLMLWSVGFVGHMGVYITLYLGQYKTLQNKFYISSSCAKHIFITVPLIISFVLNVCYDLVCTVLAAIVLGESGLSDAIIYFSLIGGIMFLITTLTNKKNMKVIIIIPVLGIMLINYVAINNLLINGFGMSVMMSVAIAVIVYAVSIVAALLTLNIWWKMGDRFNLVKYRVAWMKI